MTLKRTGKVATAKIGRHRQVLAIMPPVKFPRITAALVSVTIFVWAVYVFASQYLLPINTLYVTGTIENVDKTLLKKTTQDAIKRGFFAVDVNAVKDTLHNLPWIQNVSVRRVWPDGLHIHIKEHTAVARWGQSMLVNELGELFSPQQQSNMDNLPILIGAEGMHYYLFEQLRELRAGLEGTGLSVSKLVYDARHSMRVTFDNDVDLLLGRVQSVSENYAELLRFADAYRTTLAAQSDKIVGIDLRYTNGFAVRWKSVKSSALKENTLIYNKKHDNLRT